jgi:hypothetical protein
MALRLLAPYVLAAVALAAIAAYDLKYHGRVSFSIIAWGCVLVALVVVRQVLTIIENQHLARQVTALLDFNKAVNNTLDVNNVLSVAAKHAHQLLGADGAIAWLHLPGEHHATEPLQLEVFSPGALSQTSPCAYLRREANAPEP